jgi:N-ethylmaleimide reductase
MALIISEGTQPSDGGQGYLLTPGIYKDEQVVGWRKVTDAVRGAGGQIFVQLMHVGRISHPANTAHSSQAVAPSAVRPNAKMVTSSGLRDIPEPRALRADEIPAVIQEFRHAAAAAKMAGAKEYRYIERAAISFTSSFRTTQM